jgi:serine protease
VLVGPDARYLKDYHLSTMNHLLPSSLRACLAVYLVLLMGGGVNAQSARGEYNPAFSARPAVAEDAARVIVKFKPDAAVLRMHVLSAHASAGEAGDAATARAMSLGGRLGMELRAGRALTPDSQVLHARGISGAALARRLAAEPGVEYAVVDQRRTHFAVPSDPLYSAGPAVNGTAGGPVVGQWYLRAPAGEVASSINAVKAWELSTGSSSIVVAVLDTGVRFEHPDLVGRLLSGYDMVSEPVAANDGGGRDVDAADPGDWVTQAESENRSGELSGCDVTGSSWHGTATASLIAAASNDGVGMAGVAWGVKLLPVRVLGRCGGYDSDIIAGMLWAAGLPVPGVPNNANPARVINMSLGSSGSCSAGYRDAVNRITTKENPAVIVAAAGNSTGHAVGSPANCPGVIAVAGLRHIGTKVGFSDLGPEITISAPGGNCVNITANAPCLYPILTASNTGTTVPVASSYTDSFRASVGTSFSAPLVAGTVALMLSAQPILTPSMVKSMLQSSARPFPTSGAADDPTTGPVQACRAPDGQDQLQCYCSQTTCGAGMLDAARALTTVLGTQSHDCLLNWAERNYSGYFTPAAASQFYGPYYYRHYPATNSYLGVSSEDNHIYFLSGGVMRDQGIANSWYTATNCR